MFFFSFFFSEKRLFCLKEKYFLSPAPFLCEINREIETLYHSSLFGTVTIAGIVKAIPYYENITRLWVQRARKSTTMTSVVAFSVSVLTCVT